MNRSFTRCRRIVLSGLMVACGGVIGVSASDGASASVTCVPDETSSGTTIPQVQGTGVTPVTLPPTMFRRGDPTASRVVTQIHCVPDPVIGESPLTAALPVAGIGSLGLLAIVLRRRVASRPTSPDPS